MSWLKKVLVGKSAHEWLSEAIASEQAGEFGEAKLAYDRAQERAQGDDGLDEQARVGAARCCDALARKRLAQARTLLEAGQEDLAREELESALDTASSSEVQAEVREAMHSIERQDALEAAEPPAAISVEERFTLIASSWEALQAEELEGYGEPLMGALVALDEGRADEALKTLQLLLHDAPAPRYLWLELGRAQLASEQGEAAEQALRTFLARIGPEEGGAARLAAHSHLARLAHDRGEVETAIAELEASAAALDDDPRPYLQLGNYLRHAERPVEAVEVLELCASLFPEGQTEWPVLLELGLAHADADQDERAVAVLESVIEMLATRGHLDFPPALALTLARLHETRGNLARAADLFRALAQGSDVQSHATYHAEAARVLRELGMTDEATRMQQRADALTSRNATQGPDAEQPPAEATADRAAARANPSPPEADGPEPGGP